jgi:hypothetical protein
MEQKRDNEKEVEIKGEFRIRLGIIIIIASPILGVLLSYITCSVVGMLISDNSSANIVLVSSILATLIVGILEVIIGITEKNNLQDGGEK